MHEASLVQGILNLILKAAESHNQDHPGQPVKRVTEVVCIYGLLACFEEQTLRACFDLFAEGTIAEGASLALTPAPLSCHCCSCNADFETEKRIFACPECNSTEISFTGGHGLVVQAINVDTGEESNE